VLLTGSTSSPFFAARVNHFTEQIQNLLKGDGVNFVAVGAGHLVGEDGVFAMLEKQGYIVTRE
jgi:uncharacterized protein YbaP (TraB family)